MDKAHHWFLTHDPAYQNGHYLNIVNPDFKEIGISAIEGNYHGLPAVYVTEDFGTPTAAEAAETDKYTGEVVDEDFVSSDSVVTAIKPDLVWPYVSEYYGIIN